MHLYLYKLGVYILSLLFDQMMLWLCNDFNQWLCSICFMISLRWSKYIVHLFLIFNSHYCLSQLLSHFCNCDIWEHNDWFKLETEKDILFIIQSKSLLYLLDFGNVSLHFFSFIDKAVSSPNLFKRNIYRDLFCI